MYVGSFTRGFVFELWLSTSGSDTERRRQVLQQLIGMVPEVENVDTSNLDNIIRYICSRLVIYWKSSSRTKCLVLRKHSDWLNEKQNVNLPKNNKVTEKTLIIESGQPSSSRDSEPSTSARRPIKDFSACSKRSKRRRLAALASLDSSAVNELRNKAKLETNANEVNPDDVLSLLTEAKLTKHQYLLICAFINSRANPVLPSYDKVTDAKKKCYPENIKVTESTAEVELQSLLDHTATRIVEFQKELITAIPEESMGDVTLIGKWGFDGSTGHSEYQKKFRV